MARASSAPWFIRLGTCVLEDETIENVRKVGRVALASDSKLSAYSTRLAAHFTAAEVKIFDYDAVELAVEWAGAEVDSEVEPEA